MSETKNNTPSASSGQQGKPVRKRRLLKIVGAIVVLLLVVVALLPYIIPATWLASAIEQAAKAHIRGTFSLGAVSWGWLGGVEIDGVRIGETSEFGGGTFLKVSRVNLHVSFLDLLRKKVTVKSVTVKSPEASLIRNPEGAWNYEKIFAGRGSARPVALASVAPVPQPGGFDVAVERVRVEDGVLKLDDRKTNVRLTASGINASVDADFGADTIKGDAKVSFDLVQADGKGRFELAASDLSIPKQQTPDMLGKTSGRGTITLTGIDIGEAIAQAAPQFGRDLAAGKLTLSIDFQNSGGNIKAAAKGGQIKGLVLGRAAGFAAPVSVGDVAVSFDASATQSQAGTAATLDSLEVSTAFAEIAASGKADVTQNGQKVSAKARGSVDPAALPRGLVDLPAELSTSGRAKFEAAFEGTPAPGKFSAVVDAGAMRVVYGSALKKETGVAAAVNVTGEVLKGMISAEKAGVTLAGGTIDAKGTFDTDNKIAAWDIAADLTKLNVSDYYPGSKSLVVAGGFKNSGKFLLTTPKRSSSFSVDTKFDNLSLDVTDKPGTEVVVSGATAFTSERAEMSGLVLNVGGMPITVEGTILTPLAKPNGTIKLRGREISVDSLAAVADALASAVPAAPEQAAKAAPPAPAGTTEKTPAQKAETAGRAYLNNANVNIDAAVDRFTYQDYAGSNLKVDAGLVAGKALVRKITVDIFGGTVDVKYEADLLAGDIPFDVNIVVARIRAAETAKAFVSKWLPGLPLSNLVDVKLQAAGSGGALSTVSGKGSVDISDGTLSFGGLPGPVAALLAGLDLANIPVPKLNIPLEISKGVLAYNYAVRAGDYGVFIDVSAALAGRSTQKVGIILPGGSQKLHLFSLENGKRIDVDERQLLADLARAQLTGAFLKKETKPGESEARPAKDQAMEQIGTTILDILTKDKEKDKTDSGKK